MWLVSVSGFVKEGDVPWMQRRVEGGRRIKGARNSTGRYPDLGEGGTNWQQTLPGG